MTKPRPGSAPPIRAGSFPERARRSCPQEAQSRKRWGSRGPPRRSGLPMPVATWPQVCNLRSPAARGCPYPSPRGRRFATCGAPPLGAAHARRHVAAGLQPAGPHRSGLPMPVATWPQVCNLRCPAARGCPCPSPRGRRFATCGAPPLGAAHARRRTLAAGILPCARSVFPPLRHPGSRRKQTPAPGHGQPRARRAQGLSSSSVRESRAGSSSLRACRGSRPRGWWP
jgi:hypothetical protein